MLLVSRRQVEKGLYIYFHISYLYNMGYHGLPWATLGYLGLPWATLGYHGLPWATLGYLKATLGYLGLPWATLGYLNTYTGCPINIVPLPEHLYLSSVKVQKLANSTLHSVRL
jgi:hypothetical protein